MTRANTVAVIILPTICCTSVACADEFGSGTNVFDIEFVPIGDPNNPDDITGFPNPAGKVEYAYRMGKYEISRDMITKANNEGSLGITMDSMSSVTGGPRDEMPATGLFWFDAARFVNWLNTSTGYPPAYKFNGNTFELWKPGDAGYNVENRLRNNQAFYFLPSADEWYKAAYYDPIAGVYYDYPTGSDTAPKEVASGTAPDTAVFAEVFDPSLYSQGPADIMLAGGLSPYGTMGQGGNVSEWQETKSDQASSSSRHSRGGWWVRDSSFMRASVGFPLHTTVASDTLGFRVASVVPEPSTILLGALATGGLLAWRRR